MFLLAAKAALRRSFKFHIERMQKVHSSRGLFVPQRAALLLVEAGLGFRGKNKRKYETGCETGASKMIGDREVQENDCGMAEATEGTLAVLSDGAGKQYGGKIAARLAVQVFLDMFEDQNAFYNPHYCMPEVGTKVYLSIAGREDQVPSNSLRIMEKRES